MPKSSPSLLLLPPPPVPITAASVSAAYRPSIAATVSILKSLESSTELIVVLPSPGLHGRLHEPRSHVYEEFQRLVGGVYSLISLVCAQVGADVESDTPGAIDARIVLLNYDPSHTFSSDHDYTLESHVSGPLIDLPTLAITRRWWNLIFLVDSEDGHKVFGNYLNVANRISPPVHGSMRLVAGGISMVQKVTNPPVPSPPASSEVHSIVAVGGTFDHIHAGHKLLLTATALLLQPASNASRTHRRLIVGITGDELLKNKQYAEQLKSWKQRQEDVVDFLLSILSFTRSRPEEETQNLSYDEPITNGRAIHTKLKSCLLTIECVEIQDPFGPTITEKGITALVVSGETRSGGQAVNEKRVEKGWSPLQIFEVDVLDANEIDEGSAKTNGFASKISSTAIRKRKAENARTSSL